MQTVSKKTIKFKSERKGSKVLQKQTSSAHTKVYILQTTNQEANKETTKHIETNISAVNKQTKNNKISNYFSNRQTNKH